MSGQLLKLLMLILLASILLSCSENGGVTNPKLSSENIEITVAKWLNNKKSAMSITYDIAWGLGGNKEVNDTINIVVDYVAERNIPLDFEFVTSAYNTIKNIHLVNDIKSKLFSRGIHVFGHGHTHIPHDTVEFDSAYTEFKTCFDLMDRWGLKPRAYAYPGGGGRKERTQLALKLAGFVAGRNATANTNNAYYYICPNEVIKPKNWFNLPAISFGTKSVTDVATHNESKGYFDTNQEKGSWVILMYHSIGLKTGWAYYPLEEFKKDIDYMVKNRENIWIGGYNNVTLYIMEKNKFHYEIEESNDNEWDYRMRLIDNLENDFYNQELTLTIKDEQFKDYTKMIVSPAINSKTEFKVCNGTVELNAIPDEKIYKIKFQK